NIRLVFAIADDVAQVTTGTQQAQEVLSNLVSNALDAMSESGGDLIIAAFNAPEYVHIEVKDTGPGIPQQSRSRIFNFLCSTKGSTGFGLWRAQQCAQVNGGDLTLKDTSAKGSVFLYTIPRSDREQEKRYGRSSG